MLKRLASLLTALLLPLLTLQGSFAEEVINTPTPDWYIPPKEPIRVFFEDETAPFPEGAELMTLYVCPVKGADCMLLTYKDHSILIDAGRPTQTDQVLGMLQALGYTSMEYMFNTHPHSDHIGGVVPLLDAGVTAKSFITLFPHDYIENPNAYDYFGETLRALEAKKIPVMDLKTGDHVPFDDVELTFLRTPDQYIWDGMVCNELSTALMIRFGECSMLLTADLEASSDSQILLADLYDLKADILKYPHHGISQMAASFWREVDPEYVFFTHGAANTRDAQALLIHNGYTRMSFATWGQLTIQSDGTKWIVHQDILPDMEEIAETYRYPE